LHFPREFTVEPRAESTLGTLRPGGALALEPAGDAPIILISPPSKHCTFSKLNTNDSLLIPSNVLKPENMQQNELLPRGPEKVARAPGNGRYRTVG
jgi:hypothetical protein